MTPAGAVRGRQLALMLRPTLRSMRWQPVPVAVLAAVLLLWWKDPASAVASSVVWEVRVAALLLAAGVGGALDDHTRATLSAVPLPLSLRSGVRVGLLVVPTALAWVVLVTWTDRRVDGALPALALSLEASVVVAVVVATTAVLARWPGLPDPGVVAGPLLAGFAFGVPDLPGPLALATPLGPGWTAAHQRWAGLLVLALVVLAAAVRDPAARLRRERRRTEHPPAEGLVADDLDVGVGGGQPAAGEQHEGRVRHP